MDIDLKTTQLLVSRICHDLAGGVSAVSTGAELLADEGGAVAADAVALIASSARQSSHRLQFLRVAFGLGGGQGSGDGGDTISLTELRTLTHGFLEGGRVSLVWDDMAPGGDDRIALGAGKLVLNLCLIGSETLPRGGVMEVSGGDVGGGHIGFAVAARGDGARLTPEMLRALTVDGPQQDLTARTVNGRFTAVLAKNMAAELEIQDDEGLEVRLAVLFAPQ